MPASLYSIVAPDVAAAAGFLFQQRRRGRELQLGRHGQFDDLSGAPGSVLGQHLGRGHRDPSFPVERGMWRHAGASSSAPPSMATPLEIDRGAWMAGSSQTSQQQQERVIPQVSARLNQPRNPINPHSPPSPETKIARVATGSAAREPSLAGHARFSSLVAATSHGGLISNHALTAMPTGVFAGRLRPSEAK
jgi:hypothetical protein